MHTFGKQTNDRAGVETRLELKQRRMAKQTEPDGSQRTSAVLAMLGAQKGKLVTPGTCFGLNFMLSRNK